jgi:uncharacterized protein YceK
LVEKQYIRSCLLAALLLFVSGCSTVKVHALNHDILHPYLGTKTAVKAFVISFKDYHYYGEQYLMAVDVPFCFVADTLLFPYDFIVHYRRHNQLGEGYDFFN